MVGYGIVSRVLRSTSIMRASRDLKVGLFRPITLWPFPSQDTGEGGLQVPLGAWWSS